MNKILATISIAAAGCGGSERGEPGPDAGTNPDAVAVTIDAAGEPDAALEPMPVFSISPYTSGQLAITPDGVRPTFRIDGIDYVSVVSLSLQAEGTQDSCSVVLQPAVAGISSRSASNRVFATVIVDIGASTIVQDECGWDDAYLLSQFAGFGDGTVTVGFTRARFEEDRPYLDIYLNRSWPLPNNTASIVRVGGGQGFAMSEAGVVDAATLVEPTSGVFIPGLYEW